MHPSRPAFCALLFVPAASLLPSCSAPSPQGCQVEPVVRGPYVSRMSETGVTVRWDSAQPGCTRLTLLEPAERAIEGTVQQFQLTTDYGTGLVPDPDVPGTTYLHTVRIEGLAAGTCAHFALDTSDGRTTPRFCTARKAGEKLRFLAIGDTNPALQWTEELLPHMGEAQPDFTLHVGDMQYYSSIAETWNYWTKVMQPLFSTGAVMATVGNHEKEKEAPSEFTDYYLRLFGNTGTSGTDRWHTFQSGGVHFFSLDTEEPLGEGSEQRAWLEAALADAEKTEGFRFNVLFFHRPIYTVGDVGDEPGLRASLEPLLQAHRVKLVLSGHMHGYERFEYPGWTSITTAGGGGIIRNVNENVETRPDIAAHRQASAAKFHFMRFDVEDGKIAGQAIGTDGQPFDTFEVALP